MDMFNQITVKDIRMTAEDEDHFAYAKVILESSDYSGPVISAEVGIPIIPGTPFDNLQNVLIKKALQSLKIITSMSPVDLASAAIEGLRSDRDFGLPPID